MKKMKILFAVIAISIASVAVNAQPSANEKMKQAFKRSKYSLHESIDILKSSKHSKLFKGLASKPGNSEDYMWDEEISTWFHHSNSTYSYNEHGDLIEELSKDALTATNLSRYTYNYDDMGRLVEEATYFWNGLDWVISDGYKYFYIYDNEGNLVEDITQMWDGSGWVNQLKNVYEYNTNGEPIMMMVFEWYNNDVWESVSRYIDVVWHNVSNGQMESYTLQYKYEGGLWVNAERFNASYSGNNSVALLEYWTGSEWYFYERDTYSESSTAEIMTIEYYENSQWVNYEQYTNSLDDHGNISGFKFEYWDIEWVTEFEFMFIHTYNGNDDLTETIISYWESGLAGPINFSRFVYSNFLYFTTGISDYLNTNNIRVYPNPVLSSVNIELDEFEARNYQMEIINIYGQIVFRQVYSESTTSMNLESLRRGMYVLRISDDNGSKYYHKFLKE